MMAQDSGVHNRGKAGSRARVGGGTFSTPVKSAGPKGRGVLNIPSSGKTAAQKSASAAKARTAAPAAAMKGSTGVGSVRTISAAPPVMGPVSRSPIGGGGDVGGADVTAPMAAAAPAVSDEDYLAGESGYQAQLAALMRALSDYEADDTAQRTKYAGDYGEATKNLGWRDPDGDGAQPGNWNLEDLNTASGRGYQNQVNDFASRGMLQSSLYGEANDNFMRSMNDQLGSMNKAKTDFSSDRDRQLNSFKGENTLNQQQARAEAIARRAAGLTI